MSEDQLDIVAWLVQSDVLYIETGRLAFPKIGPFATTTCIPVVSASIVPMAIMVVSP
jgi:hypothetical protein